jgi:hypothetical protein
MKRLVWVSALSVACMLACTKDKKKKGGGDGTGEDGSGGGRGANFDHHTVLVLDDGFDSSHPVFKDKITAQYTIACEEDEEEAIDSNKSFEEQKKAMIEAYASPKSLCTVKKGISFKAADDFAEVMPFREEWNAQVLAKNVTMDAVQQTNIRKVINGIDARVNYHGTNTASLIAYENPDVKLVFVQYELRKGDDAIVEDEDDCPKQKELDDWVKLHQDEEVLEAFMNAPLSDVSQKLFDIQVQHEVTLINLSLGSPSREELEERLKEEGCGELDFSEYYKIDGKISRERELKRQGEDLYQGLEPVLAVQAAGNSGVEINDFEDTADCGDPEQGLVMVGAVDYEGKRTSFSNYGDCVQYYMIGSHVIVAAPNEFLDVTDGTSFSAPLTVRYLTGNSEPGSDASEKIKVLTKAAGTDQILGNETFPTELAYDNSNETLDAYALYGKKQRRARYDARRYYELTHPGPLK